MSDFQITVLTAIQANDGKFSWYQLDRALTHRAGVDPGKVSKDMMLALRELEGAGFIIAGVGHNPGQPLYSITASGQQLLESNQACDGETVQYVSRHG
jgi:DNA-binding HxlR family transcriptional regulator